MKLIGSFSLALITLATAGIAQAAEQYPKMYDANYDCVSGASKSAIRVTSDGKGKLRSESKAATYKVVSISDYPAKMSYTIMDAQKTVMKMPLKEQFSGTVAEAIAKKKGKDLGKKTVEGRLCHGYSYSENGTQTETWIDEKDQLMVKSTSKTGTVSTSLTLTSAKTTPPSADLFIIPKNYKVQAM